MRRQRYKKQSAKNKDYAYDFIMTLLNEDDILSVLVPDYDIMKGHTMDSEIIELLTVIKLEDNPDIKFNTTVRQPNYNVISTEIYGKGILCYQTNTLEVLKNAIDKSAEYIIKIKVKINRAEILDVMTYGKHKKYLRDFYSKLTEKEKGKINSDGDFIDYVCKKSKQQYKAVLGLRHIGQPIYDGSSITDYLGKCFVVKTEDIIISSECIS